jgi:hypothetical protein
VRHAVQTAGATGGSGRFFRLDPHALPVRHAEREAIFILDRDRAVVRRKLGGIPATLDVPVSAYSGVAVRMYSEGEDNLRVVVELLHRDPGLTLGLLMVGAPEDAALDWVTWGETLGLPLLVVEADGRVTMPEGHVCGITPRDTGPRRGGQPFRGRRSRFARRRKVGTFSKVERLEGREIIARS